MKLSVSLPAEDVALLDDYVRTAGLASRSAGVQAALRLLRHPNLEQDYAVAWQEWDDGEQQLWDGTVADGLSMRRGEIRLTDLDPARGSGASKRRPAVIVSNDRANAVAARLGRGVVTVVPISSNVSRVFPFQTLLPALATGLREDSKAQAEQVRSVSVERIGRVVAQLPPGLIAELDDALRLHLQL